ncbi:MAG: DNA polymerase III subunit chi [Paracoccaceae bacterium]
MVAVFYHLTRSGFDDLVTTLLTRALGQEWRVFLRSPDKGVLAHLDTKLWTTAEDGFLPHGLQGGDYDAKQPVLLGSGSIANDAKGLVLLNGASVDRAEVTGLERIWLLFDGADEAAVQAARAQWSLLTGWGLAAQYWADETGTWVKKVEKAAV